MKTIYIDCTYLSHHNHMNTGIQRVVRRVVDNFEAIASESELRVIPVSINNGELNPVSSADLYPSEKIQEAVAPEIDKVSVRISLYNFAKSAYKTVRELICKALPSRRVRHFMYTPRQNFGLSYLIDRILLRPVKKIETLLKIRKETAVIEIIEKEFDQFSEVMAGDILLLLDSTWDFNIWTSVGKFKEKGVKVIAVVYDLIPISHPHFCDEYLVEVFKKWFFKSIQLVDGYVAISHTVQQDTACFLQAEFGDKSAQKGFDFFHLGGDFSYPTSTKNAVKPSLIEHFSQRPSSYLIVSTIEPRKNHQYLLDVFDLLWEKELEVDLCIVGRVGWKVESLIDRINNHSKSNIRLHLWSGLCDVELAYCYANAKMLLFPSIIEGFGLPIVESLTNRLPVMASDTPIHREVGGDRIDYFDLNDPESLCQKIEEIEANGIPESLQVAEGYRWIDWRESSQMLLDKVIRMETETIKKH